MFPHNHSSVLFEARWDCNLTYFFAKTSARRRPRVESIRGPLTFLWLGLLWSHQSQVFHTSSCQHQLVPAASQVPKRSAGCQVPARQVPEPDSGAGARSPQLTRRGQVTPIQYPQYPALSLRCRHGADLAILAPAPTCVRALAAPSLLLAPAPPAHFQPT